MKIKIIDTETSCLNGSILEVGAVSVDNTFKLVSTHEHLISPPDGTVINPKAMEVHGITYEMLEGKPYFEEVAEEYNDAEVYIAHNYNFDKRMLTKADKSFSKKKWLCTLKIARMAYPDAPSYKLMELFSYLGLDKGWTYSGTAHRALYDCMVTYEVLKHIAKTLGVSTVEELIEASTPNVATMKCGFKKYRGVPWEVVLQKDRSYCEWLLGNALKSSRDEDVRMWLTKELN